jgi:hypothetical protein
LLKWGLAQAAAETVPVVVVVVVVKSSSAGTKLYEQAGFRVFEKMDLEDLSILAEEVSMRSSGSHREWKDGGTTGRREKVKKKGKKAAEGSLHAATV